MPFKRFTPHVFVEIIPSPEGAGNGSAVPAVGIHAAVVSGECTGHRFPAPGAPERTFRFVHLEGMPVFQDRVHKLEVKDFRFHNLISKARVVCVMTLGFVELHFFTPIFSNSIVDPYDSQEGCENREDRFKSYHVNLPRVVRVLGRIHTITREAVVQSINNRRPHREEA